MITRNGSLLEIGRTPNSDAINGGYYTYISPGADASGTYIKAANQLEIDNTAKQVVIRTRNWAIETKPVLTVANSGSKIYYEPTIGFNGDNYFFDPLDGYGYYFQDGISTLDIDGEWYYDADAAMLYVYFSDAPEDLQVSTIDILCSLGNYSGINISNIDFEGADKMGVNMDNVANTGENIYLSIEGCNFRYMGIRAIRIRRTKELDVSGCTFTDCLSGAVQFYTTAPITWQPSVKIHHNSFANIAPWPGMAYNSDKGDNCAVATFVSKQCWVGDNIFTDIGKAAIYWQGNDVEIKNNQIARAMKNFSDYGAIYTYIVEGVPDLTNRIIENNLIHDLPGNYYGTPSTTVIANGIYLDGTTMNVLVKSNTVFNMGSSGICSNNPRGITIENNTLYNNPNGIRYSHLAGYLPTGENININIKDNKIYNTRGQVNPTLLNTGNNLSTAIWFSTGEANWQTDLENTLCINNAYGLTNPLPFRIDVPAGTANPPARFNGLPKWSKLVVEQATRTFPARANFMPSGQAYTISNNPVVIFPLYSQENIPSTITWTNNDADVIKEIEAGQLKITFTAPNSSYASFTKGTEAITANRKYVFSYQIRAAAGTNGVCNSSVRASGCNPCTFYPTSDNYRIYTDEPVTVKYLIYVPSTISNPIFTINIQKSSGVTYINNIKIQPYQEADVQIEEATDFVDFGYYDWENSSTEYSHILPVPNTWYQDGFGFSAIDLIYFGEPWLGSFLLFKTPLINARPYNVVPPLVTIPESMDKIMLYPNPSTDIITIGKLNPADGWEQLTIINSTGKAVLNQKISTAAEYNRTSVVSLPKGSYIALLKNHQGSQVSLKFIKY